MAVFEHKESPLMGPTSEQKEDLKQASNVQSCQEMVKIDSNICSQSKNVFQIVPSTEVGKTKPNVTPASISNLVTSSSGKQILCPIGVDLWSVSKSLPPPLASIVPTQPKGYISTPGSDKNMPPPLVSIVPTNSKGNVCSPGNDQKLQSFVDKSATTLAANIHKTVLSAGVKSNTFIILKRFGTEALVTNSTKQEQTMHVDKHKFSPNPVKCKEQSLVMSRGNPVAVVNKPIIIVKKKETESSNPKSKGRAFVMSGDKTVAVEVDDTDRNATVKRKKTISVPYLVLNDGRLVKLSDIEEKVPLDQIPIPPVILLHSAHVGTLPPKISLKTNAENNDEVLDTPEYYGPHPHVELRSSLQIHSLPDGCSLPSFQNAPISLSSELDESIYATNSDKIVELNLGCSLSNGDNNLKYFVVKRGVCNSVRKKKLVVKSRNKRYNVPSCPEAVNQVENILSDPSKFKCKLCGTISKSRKRCEYHIITKHFNDSCAYECEECGKKFATNFLKKVHRKAVHFRTADHLCSICGDSFRSVGVLKGHELRHAQQEGPYQCHICDKNFYTKANRTRHIADVHSEKKTVCDICGEVFSGVGRMNQHRYIHFGALKCPHCDRTFKSKSRLQAHTQTHIEDSKLMLCPCGKKFKTFAFFHNHKKICARSSLGNDGGGNGD